MNGLDHVIDGISIPVRRFRRWFQVILSLVVAFCIASFFQHPDDWKTHLPSKGDLILAAISGMNPVVKVVSCIALEVYVIYSLIFQIIRPYFGQDRIKIIEGSSFRGFDVWGRVITAPITSIDGLKRSKALIKVRTADATLRIPIAGLNLSSLQIEHVVAALKAGSRSRRVS